MRWSLPDRIFFGCGACHILAYAFVQKHGSRNTDILWLKPAPGFKGLWLPEPIHFLHHARYRARAYLDLFPSSPKP